jgi:hypothetical protein
MVFFMPAVCTVYEVVLKSDGVLLACCLHSVPSLLRLKHKIPVLSVVFVRCQVWSLTLEDRALRIF